MSAKEAGFHLPPSDPFANVGESNQRAIQLALDAVNARGGVLGGRKLEWIMNSIGWSGRR